MFQLSQILSQATPPSNWQFYSWKIAVIGGIFAIIVGLFQLIYGLWVKSRENRLSQAQFAYKLVDELFDERSGQLLYVLDAQLFELIDRRGQSVKVNANEFEDALASSSVRAMSAVVISDCFDELLYYFDRIQQALVLKLIRLEDVSASVGYYIPLLAAHKKAILGYLKRTPYEERVTRFLDRFDAWKKSR